MHIIRSLPFLLLLSVALPLRADAPPSLDAIITQMRDRDPDKKLEAAVELQDLSAKGFTDEQSFTLLNAATESPAGADAVGDPSAQFILAAAVHPNAPGFTLLQKHFDTLSDGGKSAALEYMLRLKSPESLKFFATQFTKYAGTLDWQPSMGKSLTNALPDETVLGAIVDGLSQKNTVALCAQSLLDGVSDKKLAADFLKDRTAPISDAFHPWLKTLASLIPADADPAKKYRWTEDYRNALDIAEYFPDLLGHAGPAAEPILREALTLKDPRLSLFAIRSLLQLKLDVPQSEIDMVAADDEMRNLLYDSLQKLHAEDRFPKQFLTQDAFARSEMVSWLIYPTELNHPPTAIEQTKTVDIDTHSPDGVVTMYLYRFRDAPDEDWEAGIAGAYPKSKTPTTRNLGQTFSDFDKYDAMTPDEHIAKITQQIEEAWKQKAAEAATQPASVQK